MTLEHRILLALSNGVPQPTTNVRYIAGRANNFEQVIEKLLEKGFVQSRQLDHGKRWTITQKGINALNKNGERTNGEHHQTPERRRIGPYARKEITHHRPGRTNSIPTPR